MAKRTEMGEDVQEVVARWVFGWELEAVTERGETSEFVEDSVMTTQ